jgi:hypothetical protein
LLDLKELSIEELSGRLVALEGRGELETNASRRLLLTEEEWLASSTGRQLGSGGSGFGGKQPTPHKERPSDGKEGARGGGLSQDNKCRYCGKKGHWTRECRKKNRDEERQAHLVQHEDEADPALLMAVRVLDDAIDALMRHGVDVNHRPVGNPKRKV